MKNNENIDEQSIESLKEYQAKRIKQNICLHKVCLIMLFFINLGLLIFAILYKKQISTIRIIGRKNLTNFEEHENFISQRSLLNDKKIMRILARSYFGKFHFSYLIENSEDLNLIKNLIVEFYKEKGKNYDINRISCEIIYQNYVDGVTFENVMEVIEFYNNIVVLFSNSKGRFGVYFENEIILDDGFSYVSESDKCFIFSFNTKKMYKYIGNKYSVKVSKDKIFDFGNGDIIVYSNYTEVPLEINFPFKSFDVSTINDNPFSDQSKNDPFFEVEIFYFSL